MVNSIQQKVFTVQGFRTHCYWAGESGAHILLLHGAGLDSALLSWGDVIGPLAEQYRVYAPDLPGYGQTEYKANISYSNTFYTRFIHDLIQELRLEKPILIGLSMGGSIAIEYALTYPHQVKALGLVCSYGLLDRWPGHCLTYHGYVNTPLNALSYKLLAKSRFLIKQLLKAGLIYNPHNINEKLIDQIQQAAQSPHAGKAFQSFQKSEYLDRGGLKSNFMQRLSEIKVPVLILHGTHDRTVPVKYAHLAHQRIPNSELHLMKKTRHWPQKERPDEFVQMVTSFLQKIGVE